MHRIRQIREHLSHQENRYLLLAIICMGALIVFLYSVRITVAHEHGRPELDSWFRSLHSNSGSPCCDAGDFDAGSAKRLDDVDWDTKDGHYRVRLDGQWVDVPDSAVVPGANRAGAAMVWPFYLNGELIGVRCFMPGAGI